MSNQQEKVYVDGVFIKTATTTFGNVLKVNAKVDALVKFLLENQDEGGWIKFDIVPKKQVDDKGRSHNCVLDTWKPNQATATVTAGEEDLSDLPF